MFACIRSPFCRRNLSSILHMNSVKHQRNQMKIRSCMTTSVIVIFICVLVIEISDCHPGHVHQHDFILEHPSPIFSSRSDAEWNGQIIVFPASSKRGINPWIQNRQATIKLQREVKSAGREEAVHTTADPIAIENGTEVLKVSVPKITVTTVSHLHHRTADVIDKRLNLYTKDVVNTKKGKEEHRSRQLSTSPPTKDIISERSPKWLNSDVQALTQPPVMTSKSVSMSAKSTYVDPFRRFLSKAGNDNDVVSKTRESRLSDVTYVQPERIIQFNPDGKVNKKGGVSDILDRGADLNGTEATIIYTLNTNQEEDKKLSNQVLLINNQTIIRPENQISAQKKATTEKIQRLEQKKEEHSSFPIRRYNRGNVTASAKPVERRDDAPSNDSGQLKALNQESSSRRKLVPSIVNVDDFFFFLNHSNRKDDIIKGSKTLNQSNVITSVNEESWSNGRSKAKSHSDKTQMQLNGSKQQGLAVTEQIKHSQDILDLLYESDVWTVSFIDSRSILSSNREILGKQQNGSSKELNLGGKNNLESQPQVSRLNELRKTNTISTTLQTPYSTTVFEISSDGGAGNKSYLSMKSIHGQSNSNVNDTNQRNVYRGKKYDRNGTAPKRPESVPEPRERYVTNKGMSTMKPNYDTKRGNQTENWIRKEPGNTNMNSTSHPDRSFNNLNSVNDTSFETEMHTYSGILETLNTKLTELPSVLDAPKSLSDSVKWMQSTIEPNNVSTRTISTLTGGTSTSYSETTVRPQTSVRTLERTTIKDRELPAELLIYEDLLRIFNASSTKDLAMGEESNTAEGIPIPIVRNSQAKSENSLQSNAQINHLGTIVDMIIRDALASESGTTAYPHPIVRTVERTTMDSDKNAELLMYLEFMRTLNEI